MDKSKFKIFVAGHKGLVGSAIIRELNRKGYKKIITASKSSFSIRSIDAKYLTPDSKQPEEEKFLSQTAVTSHPPMDCITWCRLLPTIP